MSIEEQLLGSAHMGSVTYATPMFKMDQHDFTEFEKYCVGPKKTDIYDAVKQFCVRNDSYTRKKTYNTIKSQRNKHKIREDTKMHVNKKYCLSGEFRPHLELLGHDLMTKFRLFI